MRARNRWIPALFFVLLPIVPLWKSFFLGLCIGPFDQIRQMAPWHGPTPSQPWDILQADGVLQFFPWRNLVLNSWSHLRPPFWNPYELAGTPLLANSQSAGFYPPHILLGLLHTPTTWAMLFLAWGHLTWAGLGVFKICRRLNGGTLSSMIGGTSFVLTPFMLSWTALPSVITTASWIPWCLAYVLDIFSENIHKNFKIATIPTVKLAICIGMMILSGHLQFAAYGVMAILAMTGVALILGKQVISNRASSSLSIVLALILGFFVAAPQLVPVLTFSKTSNRQNQASEDGYSAYAASAIQPFEFANLINPLALGNPRESVDDKHVSLSTYWPAVVKRGGNFAESAITIGPFLLGLLALVSWRNRKLIPIAAVGLLALLLCSGTFLDRLLYFYIPGWSATGSPGRICVLFLIAVSVLAGTIPLKSGAISKKRLFALAALIVLGIACSVLGPMLSPLPPGQATTLVDAQRASGAFGSLTTLIQSTAIAIVGFALLTWKKASRYCHAVVIIPILLSLVAGGLNWITVGNPSLVVGGPPDQTRVAYINQDWPLLGGKDPNTPPNISSLNQIHELGGYDSLLNGDTVAFLNKINGEDSAPPENGNMMFIKNENIEGLRQAGVSYIGTGSDLRPIPNALGRFTYSGGSCSIASEDLTQITLKLSGTGTGTLTLRDRQMPGWTATLDGSPVPITPGLWRIVEIPSSGAHVLRFSYAPPGLKLGLLLFALFFVIASALIGLDRRNTTQSI